MVDRKFKLAAVYEQLENDMQLLGVTAVEDKLQQGVPDTLDALRQAGIRLWVLTGERFILTTTIWVFSPPPHPLNLPSSRRQSADRD